ncbi:hypothetical protein BN874_2210003 [Candidatus Contendobacter odensis Run_B_J11]|uniref:Uncharacterized protein n=1 Tax=Candidatus Contendobacter odensis Run_B_J11 TaxID=1400861 RepID=A0A7U7J4G0_9GAMM|nr:hypothetical protein BN874_2210003 [Candidatus Contendobacter odensis Run_B_J11]
MQDLIRNCKGMVIFQSPISWTFEATGLTTPTSSPTLNKSPPCVGLLADNPIGRRIVASR